MEHFQDQLITLADWRKAKTRKKNRGRAIEKGAMGGGGGGGGGGEVVGGG